MAAVTTPAQVCNLALAAVGSRQFIDDLGEATLEAEVCNRLFASVRNELLAAWPWRFATRRAVLGLTAEVRTGWGYCYTLPADCLVARRIWDGKRLPGAGQSIPFSKELNDAGGGFLLVTDQPQAELEYTAEVTTVALWPPHFVTAVAAVLATHLASALSVKPQVSELMMRRAQLALTRAAAVDANEAQRDEEPDSEFIRERG